MSGTIQSLIGRFCLWGGLTLLLACSPAENQPADLVFTGGGVYTVDEAQPWAGAVAVRNGRIVYVGDDAGALALTGGDTEVIDLDGRMLMPGFHDSHMHPMSAGTRFLRCRLYDLDWPQEVLEKIADCAENREAGAWLRGVGLADSVFEGGGLHRDLLDEIVSDSPVVISNDSGFLAWMNSRAFEVTGIDSTTPDPDKGMIERDPVTGEPSGVLRNEAVGAVYKQIPYPDILDLREALRLASEMANGYGITSVNAAQVRPALHEAYLEADRAGEMTLRVQASLAWDLDRGMEQLDDLIERRATGTGPRYRADAVKLYLDGDIQRRTAALLEPYVETPGDHGRMSVDMDSLGHLVEKLDSEGFQVHIHVVGDRVVRSALDAFAQATAVNGPMDRRHQLAHIELIDPQDLPRFSELGVVADYQLLWAYLSPERQDEIDALGPARANRLLAIRSMIDSGARVVAGSDWISESMNPLFGIQIAVTRRPPDGSGPAWIPGQRVTLAEMIEAYTTNGAWLARQEDQTGSIEIGKAADLIVLERNLFEVDPMELKDVRVLLTLIEGRPVFGSILLE